MMKIVDRDSPILRQKAKSVLVSEIGNDRIKKIISEMKSALKVEEDGVAIAAPQIGESLRIFVVSGRVLSLLKSQSADGDKRLTLPDQVFINPEIIKTSKKRVPMEEGCLSVRWLYGKVSRAKNATVQAYTEDGQKFTRGGSDLLAQIFQHEIDHLDGIIFTDKAEEIIEILPKRKNV